MGINEKFANAIPIKTPLTPNEKDKPIPIANWSILCVSKNFEYLAYSFFPSKRVTDTWKTINEKIRKIISNLWTMIKAISEPITVKTNVRSSSVGTIFWCFVENTINVSDDPTTQQIPNDAIATK